jgi:hypothetical protein
VAHDRDRGLAIDDLLRHRVALRAGDNGGHGVGVRREGLDSRIVGAAHGVSPMEQRAD